MNPERWTRLRSLTERCLDLTPAERETLLDDECVNDEQLRHEVDRLLLEDGRPDPFTEVLEPALASLGRGARLVEQLSGRRLGRYHVLELLGRGGMGAVYEAQQEEPQRRVALKVLDLGLASPDARARFLYEAEILARLTHPGIAQILEAGTADIDGVALPWFAMQHVPQAHDLMEHAHLRSLDANARIALFLQLCDAVQHGHEQGVVHRDLKPSNVLVDGAGRVRVIDFGVARASGPAGARHTTAGQLLGTLPYMSPEQVAGDPDAVDTRSDVYSLGLLLRELLSGTKAYDLDGLNLPEAARVIATRAPASLSSVAPALPEDLEWILGRALEKDKRDRYASVSELAADLRRLQAHEPVLASPPTRSYRVRKFVRRHRLSVVLSALVLLSLLGGLVGTLLSYFGEQEQRAEAQRQGELAQLRAEQALRAGELAEERRADAEAARALADERLLDLQAEQGRLRASRDFLTSMFESVRGRRDPESVRVVEILDDASSRLAELGNNEPLVQAELHHEIGSALGWLGRHAQASKHLSAALALQREHLPPGAPESFTTLTRLAITLEGEEQLEIENTLLDWIDTYGERLSDTAISCLHRRGRTLRDLGRLDASRADLIQALERLDEREAKGLDVDRRSMSLRSRTLGELARTYLDLDEHALAERAFIDLAAQLVRQHGLDGAPPADLGDAAEQIAEALERALATFTLQRDADLELDDLSNRAQDLYALMLHRAQRDEPQLWEPAERLIRATLAIDMALYGSASRSAAVTRMSLSQVLSFLGDAEAAEAEARTVLSIYLALDGDDARSVALARLSLAQALNFQGRNEEAELEVRETLRIYEARMGADAWPVAEMRVNHGIALRNLERYDEAESALLGGYAVLEAQLGLEHGQVQWVRSEIATLYELMGRDEDSARWSPGADGA
ncbi:MAG: hypothetical protein DHS20C15_03050 [Planctomycetota bacterium]|nr:MAG: hypothetical protein DHS20C15_03050 [Planctomycetota bacterium]